MNKIKTNTKPPKLRQYAAGDLFVRANSVYMLTKNMHQLWGLVNLETGTFWSTPTAKTTSPLLAFDGAQYTFERLDVGDTVTLTVEEN